MAFLRAFQSTSRSPLCLQRWLMRLVVLTVVVYGSLLFTFWTSRQEYTPAPYTVVRHQALKGMLSQQEYAPEAVALVQINTNGDKATKTKTSSTSGTNWEDLALEMLPDVGSSTDTSSSDARAESSGVAKMLERSTLSGDTLSPKTDEQEYKTNSDINSGSLTTTSAQVDFQLMLTKAEEHARTVKQFPSGETRTRSLKCIGWQNTGDCDPNGPREPQKDLSCDDFVPKNASGYCEVEDTKSGERFRVMRRSCNILRNRVPFRCVNAPAFARIRVQAGAVLKNFSEHNYPDAPAIQPHDGIVMVVYPKLVPSAYATIRTLKENLNCSLPIEIWYRPDEMKDVPEALTPLKILARNTSVGHISFQEIVDPIAKRFVAKIYAIHHSSFDRVLFLDADNVPVRDPSFLFQSPEFVSTGALFWPDFWHPTSTMFGLHSESLLWELLDMNFVDMFEQESGQLVVDRRRHAAPLELVFFYAAHEPNFFVHYKLVWGDKDLFRLAWLKLNTSFHMIGTPPAMAGMVTNTSAFCGMTMVQHDAKGEVLFLHRNKNKLTGLPLSGANSSTGAEQEDEVVGVSGNHKNSDTSSYPDPAIWTQLMSFHSNFSRDHYVVQAFTTSLEFTSKQKCFGRRSLRQSPQFGIQTIADLSFAGFETKLRYFAKEAATLSPEN